MTGITRPIDDLGRIVIPKELRDANHIRQGDRVMLTPVPNGILLSNARSRCALCGGADDLLVVDGVTICLKCGEKIKEVMG